MLKEKVKHIIPILEKDKYKEYGFCDCILEPIEEKSINIIDKYLK